MKTQVKLMTIGLFFFTGTVIVSCSKKDIAPLNGKVALQINSVNSSLLLNSGSGSVSGVSSALDWNAGFMNVSSIEAKDGLEAESNAPEGKENSKTAESLKEDSVKNVNLFIPNQQIGIVNIAPGNYDSLLVKLQITQTPTSPALFLKGNYTNQAGLKKPVEFSLNEGIIDSQLDNQEQGEHQGGENDDLKILATLRKLVISAQSSTVASIKLDYRKLLNGVTASDFDNAVLNNGIIIINKTTNISIYNKIKANISKFSNAD